MCVCIVGQTIVFIASIGCVTHSSVGCCRYCAPMLQCCNIGDNDAKHALKLNDNDPHRGNRKKPSKILSLDSIEMVPVSAAQMNSRNS